MKKAINKLLNVLLDTILVVLLILTVLNFSGILTFAKINGTSMYPTYNDGQFIVAKKQNVYKNNDVVITAPLHNSHKLIKRIIAVGGQTIEIINGDVYVDNKKLNETYVKYFDNYNMPLIRLNDNEVFIMGDNRINSYDSRFLGPIKISNITGKVLTE